MMAGIEEIAEHSIEVEIDKARTVAQQERVAQQHLLKRQKASHQAVEQRPLLFAPQ